MNNSNKTLVIAEKPSVALDLVRALTPLAGKFEKHDEYHESERYIVTSAVGHLVEIAAPEAYEVKRGKWSFARLPVIPPQFDLRPIEKSKGRLNAVVKLAKRKDVGALINACDAGREGELIFRLIEQYAGGSKGLGKPVERLWLQSMTPQAIRDGFAHLRSDAQMRPLADAARSRSEADWLVGINGTRALTAFNSRDGGFFLTTVGRVQTPTLAVVVEREEKIRAFKSRDYWEIHATFAAQAGSYAGKWFDPAFKKPSGEAADAELKADRLWNAAAAEAIAAAVRGQPAQVSEESKPSTQASGLLYDLTSLQREANGRFGFSAKTTLALAQSLYERHKALTYPRTDSRALPEDYLPTVQQTVAMLAASGLAHLAPHARTAIEHGYIRPSKRVFDNAKVSDHFAIIPTLQAPSGLSEAEQKLYDLVARRFLAVFFPPAEFLLTTRISTVRLPTASHAFKTEGKVLVKPGWMAVYGKEAADEAEGAQAGDKGQRLVPVQPDETVRNTEAAAKALQTRPPARYNEATLLGAMEGAGKLIDDEELRSAMADKGLGTPATRAAIIEGLLSENYLLREGREIIPTAKAFQLMTLLRGLQVPELCKPELTGEWEHKLALMERGQLSRADFMRQIADLTERMVRQAKEYDRDSVPGDYATLGAPCPHCGGVVRENYRRYACTGAAGVAGADGAEGATAGSGQGCGFSFGKSPAGRTFELPEAEAFLRDKRIGPLQGFRSKAGWPFVAELALAFNAEEQNWKLEFDFGDDKKGEASGELADFSAATPLGPCPKCASPVYAHGSQYVCSHAVPSSVQAETSCDFKSGAVILQQVIEPEQMGKLLHGGKTDLLQRFVSNKTRRTFKAYLVWDAAAGKVGFEFEPRAGKAGVGKPAARKTAAKPAAAQTETQASATVAAKPAAARKTPARKPTKAGAAEPAAKPVAVRKTAVRKTAARKSAV
ncbi:DNA topoisomerase III, partial [Serpentinimonas barnesii]|uniref:DNA topoisomerase III n=1 Tax=Serpentinimonas barnesii TaxID=1458427 RepID=UPI000495282C